MKYRAGSAALQTPGRLHLNEGNHYTLSVSLMLTDQITVGMNFINVYIPQ